MSNELILKLYVAGEADRMASMRERLTALLDQLLARPYRLIVIDVLTEPHLADLACVLVTPTLVIQFNDSERRLVGDLSDLSMLQLVIQDHQPARDA